MADVAISCIGLTRNRMKQKATATAIRFPHVWDFLTFQQEIATSPPFGRLLAMTAAFRPAFASNYSISIGGRARYFV